MSEEKSYKQPLRMDEYYELRNNVLEEYSNRSFKQMLATTPGLLAVCYGEISSFVHGGAMGNSYSNLEIGCILGGLAWAALTGLLGLSMMLSTRTILRSESQKAGFVREYYIVDSW